jgi:4-amino-4-deoxy-L-arabinose transferase-like glycosyltransferase
VMWFERVPSAEIDMVQLAWVVGSLYCFYRAYVGEEIQGSTKAPMVWWIAALLCVAGGLLTKWTAPIFFYATTIPFVWWRDRLRLLFTTAHLTGLAVAVALVSLWIAAVVWCVGWGRLYDTVCQEALPKFLPGQRERGYPWLEIIQLPARVLVGSLPWTGFALLTLNPKVSRDWSQDAKRLLAFFHCWLWPNLLFWSLAPNHAPRHSFPLSPAIAGLATLVLVATLSKQLRWPRLLPPAAPTVAVILTGIVVAKVVFVSAIMPDRIRGREPVEKGEMLARLVPPDATLYLFGVKDEGLMFYYDRPVRRLRDPALLPAGNELLYCIITDAEYQKWRDEISEAPLHELEDEQGAKLLLVRIRPDPLR